MCKMVMHGFEFAYAGIDGALMMPAGVLIELKLEEGK